MSHFDFKQFRICHDRCAMKVGTDGVLLGAWADTRNSQKILDIGTGSGLIAIMIAQRSNAKITGIEIDESAARQAQENVDNCPFSEKIEVINSDIKEYQPEFLFDNIVSNPPFFTESVLPPNANRAAARHTEGLSLQTLVTEAQRLMKPDALFQVILPYDIAPLFLSICAVKGLSLVHRTDVCTKVGKPFKRVLLCMVNNISPTQPTKDVLSLSDGGRGRSIQYDELTKDYYL